MTLDINQITWIHNIDVTLQLVSAQKDAYASELRERERERECVRERERERESERERERERESV